MRTPTARPSRQRLQKGSATARRLVTNTVRLLYHISLQSVNRHFLRFLNLSLMFLDLTSATSDGRATESIIEYATQALPARYDTYRNETTNNHKNSTNRKTCVASYLVLVYSFVFGQNFAGGREQKWLTGDRFRAFGDGVLGKFTG